MPGKHRPFAIQILVSPTERDEVLKAAAHNAMSASTYARSRLLTAMRREAKLEEQTERRLGILEEEDA